MGIDLNKIATNALSTLVVVVFVGAGSIVWKGATSVDTKIQETKEDVQYLIDTLSDQLANQQVMMNDQASLLNSMSNQLHQISIKKEIFGPVPPLPETSKPEFVVEEILEDPIIPQQQQVQIPMPQGMDQQQQQQQQQQIQQQLIKTEISERLRRIK